MNELSSYLAALRRAYLQQGPVGKVILPAALLLAFCCFCLLPLPLLRARAPLDPTPSQAISPTLEGTQPTPTPLFDFDFATFTPFPTATFAAPSPFPTWTPLPAQTATPTQSIPTATVTPVPTATPVPPTATPTIPPSVVIINVNKAEEYTEIQNLTQEPVNLRNWRLLSVTGNQSCDLRGTLEPGEILRIWSRRGNPGFDCRFSGNIWRDNEPDPAVLYNAQGEEVSRYP